MLRASGLTDKGPVRPINEDCFVIDEGLSLSVVADGMGGHNAGEVAAHLAVETIVECCTAAESAPAGAQWPFGFDPSLSVPANLLRTAVHIANTRILEAANASADQAGMGTTVVATIVRDGRVSVVHVGDSRVYLYAEGRLRLLTRDDSWIASVLAEDPSADPALYLNHPMRHALTNVVGAEARIDVHVRDERLPDAWTLLLTTDGVHGVLPEGRLEEILRTGGAPADIAANLLHTALMRGSRDNCTAVVVQQTAG